MAGRATKSTLILPESAKQEPTTEREHEQQREMLMSLNAQMRLFQQWFEKHDKVLLILSSQLLAVQEQNQQLSAKMEGLVKQQQAQRDRANRGRIDGEAFVQRRRIRKPSEQDSA